VVVTDTKDRLVDGALRVLSEEGLARASAQTVLAQLLAGAQTGAGLAPVVAEGLSLWIAEIEAVLRRLMAGMPFADLPNGLGPVARRALRAKVHRIGTP